MTKKDLINLIKEVLDEQTPQKTFHVSLDRPGAGWSETITAQNLQQAIKIANAKHASEPPADTFYEVPSSKVATSMKPNPVSPDIKAFGDVVYKKFMDRYRQKGSNDRDWATFARDVVIGKLKRDGWTRSTAALKESDHDLENMRGLLKKAKKVGDHEQAAFYTQALQQDVKAIVSWEKFKGSWAYERWIKNPSTQELIKSIKADWDSDAWKRYESVGESIGNVNLDLKSIRDIEVDGVDSNDAPDFVDAYVVSAVYPDGKGGFRDLTDDELDWLNNEHPEVAQEKAYDSLYESKKRK